MRILKLALASLVALGMAAVAGVQIAGHYFAGASAVASAPASAMMAMPVPVAAVVKKTLPIYLDYPGRIESIRSIALQARVSGYIDAQPATFGRRSIRRTLRRSATRPRSNMRRPVSAAARNW
jgi:membrane fusion protein, multidrug efflux system